VSGGGANVWSRRTAARMFAVCHDVFLTASATTTNVNLQRLGTTNVAGTHNESRPGQLLSPYFLASPAATQVSYGRNGFEVYK